MNFKCIIIVSAILLILSLGAISAADLNETGGQTLNADNSTSLQTGVSVNQTLNADNSTSAVTGTVANSTDNATMGPGTFEDLQKEVDNAPAKSVLNLVRDYNGHDGAKVQCDKDLTIDGHGHTIDCLGKCIAFYSKSGLITLKNLKIVNGHSNGNGGAICSDGTSRYIFENCTFLKNWAKGLGGAIYSRSFVTVSNSTMNGNTAKTQGGVIYSLKNVHVSGSKFNQNQAVDSDGGTIYSKGYVLLSESTITNSHSGWSGGAVYSKESVNLLNSQILYNNANGNGKECRGGAIRAVKEVDIINCSIVGNYALTYGGAIYAKTVKVDFFDDMGKGKSAFRDNHASNFGGAIYAEDNVYLNNSIFTYNSALNNGGAVYCNNNADVKNSNFENNKAQESYGGAICAHDVKIDACIFCGNYADSCGGAILATSITFANTSSAFSENSAARCSGGAIWTDVITNNEVSNIHFYSNSAGMALGYMDDIDDLDCYGGAIYVGGDVKVTFSKCAFLNNHALSKGGAIFMDDSSSSLSLKDNYFSGNYVPVEYSGEGCCVYSDGDIDTVSHNFWNGNEPSKDNSVLIEWIFLFPNIHHTDSNPAKSIPFPL